MSWRAQLEPDWLHEAPFYLVALIAHGALLSLNPVIRWGSLAAPEKTFPIEFVTAASLPPIISPIAPPRPSEENFNTPPKRSPKKSRPGKVKKRHAALPLKSKPRLTAKPVVDGKALKRARQAQTDSKRLRMARAIVAEKAVAAKAVATALAAEKKRIALERTAEVNAERARFAAERKIQQERRAEAEREAAERRAAVRAEQQRLDAEVKAAKAAKRAELSSALDKMADPEALEAAPTPGDHSAVRKGRPIGGKPLAGKTGAIAALAESFDAGDAARSDGADQLDSKTRGGGISSEGGVFFSMDGAVDTRRILSRVSPESPDWIATRNLDLSVTVRFQVMPDGSVKPGAAIQKTSGFPDIDVRAVKALSRWRFQPVSTKAGATEVWGRVTFRFTS